MQPLILVVDDDPPIVILMRSLLREFGFETMTATTGADAVQAARSRTPDLVLLDKNMPGMTGEEVIRALRLEPGLARVPILILSGEPMSPVELARIGADGAILKPFDIGNLIDRIRAITAPRSTKEASTGSSTGSSAR